MKPETIEQLTANHFYPVENEYGMAFRRDDFPAKGIACMVWEKRGDRLACVDATVQSNSDVSIVLSSWRMPAEGPDFYKNLLVAFQNALRDEVDYTDRKITELEANIVEYVGYMETFKNCEVNDVQEG